MPCALGNTGRNQFRGPAYFSDNLSMFKVFPIHHDVNLEARFDAFNLGKITSTLGSGVGNVNGVGGSRVLQAAVKITF